MKSRYSLTARAAFGAATLACLVAASFAHAANQTATVTPIELNPTLPYKLTVEAYDFGAADLPTLHSFAAGEVDGKWVLIAGRTNGLHGFNAIPDNNFPP